MKQRINQNCAASENFYDSDEVYNWHDGNKNSLRTIEAQVCPKNNEARPKFAVHIKKACSTIIANCNVNGNCNYNGDGGNSNCSCYIN